MSLEDEKARQRRRLLTVLARERVVTTRELARMLDVDRAKAVRVARALREKGLLMLVKRGVYAVVPLEAEPNRFEPDPVLSVHAALGDEYAFSHFTALQLHGAEHHAHKTVHVSRPGARPRRLRVGRVPVHVHDAPEADWASATTTMKRGRTDVRVTTPERTLIDLVGLPPKEQDYSELVEALRGLEPKLSSRDLVEQALRWANNTTKARLGHLLSHHAQTGPDPLEGRTDQFRVLQSPYYFGTRPRDPKNRLDREFNVIYPGEA